MSGAKSGESLLEAAIEVLGERVLGIGELRAALTERGVDLGTADRHGHDELDRLVHLTPALSQVSMELVAHLPSLFAGIGWSVTITADDARNGFLVATPQLEPLLEMMIDGDVRIVGPTDPTNSTEPSDEHDATAGEVLGVALVDGAEIDGTGVDVVILPPGLLNQLAGHTATFTIVDPHTVRVEAVDPAAVNDATDRRDARIAAVRAAFDQHAEARTVPRPVDGTEVELTTAGLEGVIPSAVVADPTAFRDGPLPPIDRLVVDAGLSVHGGLVGEAETDWAALRAWQAAQLVQINHEFTDEQAAAYALLVDAPRSSAPIDVSPVVDALADAKVAELAWNGWADTSVAGAGLDEFVASLPDGPDASGVAWLRSRQLTLAGETEQAIAALETARESGHAMVLADLAAVAADRSEPLAAKALLDEAGVSTDDVDLDDEFDPVTSGTGFARELAEEIAPFAALRPKAMAGRNDPCPCGSGRKYKQCHLGNELHALEHRAGWLYVKMMRFMQLTNPAVTDIIADTIVSAVASPDLHRMLRESYLPTDMALHEGRVADRFLEAKRSLLPTDEIALAESWIDTTRSAYEVARSATDSMDVIDLATRERLTVRNTVPEEPLASGWKVIGRLVPVDDTFRAYSGFLPINDDMVDVMLQGFATRQLEMVAITIGQIFETAETQDSMQALFDDGLDDTELRELIEQMAEEMADEIDDESD